jgi:hypothetical protein
MHFGMVCAELPVAELVTRLRRVGGEMLDRGAVSDPNRFNPSASEGSAVIAGERDGKGYLMDESMLLSGAEPDVIVAIASIEPPALVVGCGAETVSGTYWLIAARGPEVIRSYFHCHSDLAQPFQRGAQLASEQAKPLDGDADGHGLTAALTSLGFDFDGWFSEGPWNAFLYTGEGADVTLANGPLGQAQSQHHARFKLPPEKQPTMKIVTRDPSGAVVDVSDTGVRLGDIGARRATGVRGLIKRLIGR